jgi:two-component system, cell cycle sensor histidine kinase and response regulator CckA
MAHEVEVLAAENEVLRRRVEALEAEAQRLRRETEARQRFSALSEEEGHLLLVLNNVSDVIFAIDVESDGGFRFSTVNRRFLETTGLQAGQVVGVRVEDVIPEPARSFVLEKYREALRTGAPVRWEELSEYPAGKKLGHVTVVPVFDAAGSPRRLVGMVHDLTERLRAEDARRELEDQLRAAQKLEAVGQLAGGVAHDFNNLLAVILNYAWLLMEQLPEGDPAREDAREIAQAGESAAALTRQLLAFSRKQVLEPRVLDLNTIVSRLDKMLRRLIGEHLRLALELAPELGRVKADPGQLEQVVMNLVVNARDAMAAGGTLTLATADVDLDAAGAAQIPEATPGPYVLLRVRDTGHGMDAATQQRIFEPFFTTKALGSGTGLGLSTVYGIVRQSGGTIRVQSAPGRGTTFEVYLPRVDEALNTTTPPPAQVRALAGNETLLVVEDDDAVRRVTERLLRAAGYRLLTAASPAEALRLDAQHSGPLHLLLTDVVMPGMGGRELAARLRQRHPELRVLYMSGYSHGQFGAPRGLDADGPLVAKPFSASDLTRSIRHALDAPRAGGTPPR